MNRIKQNDIKRILSVLLAVIALLCMNISTVSVFAASNGIYIADAAPHYRHPVTGTIEDAGGESSETLGQSMTESATYTKALVEVDASGNTYVTVRLKLMDNIQEPEFQVDGQRSGSFSAVAASLMQEDYTNNTADFRMKVPSENAVIRCNMYVVPMGREVIFYVTVSNLQSGSDDFITSVKIEETSTKETTTEQTTEKETAPSVAGPETTAVSETTLSATTQPKTENTTKADLQEFDASGNQVDEKSETDEKGNGTVSWIIGGIVVAAAAGVCVWYFCFYKKKK